jgi:hypothetical protein
MSDAKPVRRDYVTQAGPETDFSAPRSVHDVWAEWVQDDPELGELFKLTADAQDRYATFLRALAAYRKHQQDLAAERGKYTQDWVAERMNTSQPRVAVFEKGDQDVKSSTVAKYAAALGCRLELRAIDSTGQVVASSAAFGESTADQTRSTSTGLEDAIKVLARSAMNRPAEWREPEDASWLVGAGWQTRMARGPRDSSNRSNLDTDRVHAEYQILRPTRRGPMTGRAALAQAVSGAPREAVGAAI